MYCYKTIKVHIRTIKWLYIQVHKMNINDYTVQNYYEMTINVQKVIINWPYKYTKWQYHDDKSTQNENRTSINLHKRNLQ